MVVTALVLGKVCPARPAMETTEAILLRKTKLSETSLIITWFSLGHGKLKTVAKGARRPKSSFSGKLDLFFEAEIQYSRSRKSELHTLKEVVLTETHEGVRQNFQKVQLGAYFMELIELVTELEQPAPELYDLLQRAFRHINKEPASGRALLHFEKETARLLGIADENVTAAVAIGRVYGRLPQLRSKLQLPP